MHRAFARCLTRKHRESSSNPWFPERSSATIAAWFPQGVAALIGSFVSDDIRDAAHFVNESGFSEQLEHFIAREIASLEQLEILLFVSGNPHKWWTVQDVYNVVKSSPPSVGDRLNEMVERGFLQKEIDAETRYQFAPANEDVWNVTSELRNAYKEKPVKVVQAIYSKPPDAVQEFAKAFRLRKDK
jgi:hypothetical protein